MTNPNQRESSKHTGQLAAVSTIELRKRSQQKRDGHILHQIGVRSGGHEQGIVGVAIGLLDAGAGFAVFGDGLVALPGVEVDARLDDVEGQDGAGEDEGDGEGAGYGEQLAQTEDGGGVGHGDGGLWWVG